ncbi:MAG: mechanosensitive ion channel family protein [DPANN group archaeon]|nr:mechanosensitive ion channel family protein [DPANN group archaeon]
MGLEQLLDVQFLARIDYALLTMQITELLVLVFFTFLGLKTLPFIPRRIDDAIKRWDLPETAHMEIANIIRFFIWSASIGIAFIIFGHDPLGNQVYELVLLFYGMKVFLSIVRPSIRRLDDRMDSFDFSEDTHKLIENGITYSTYVATIVIALGVLGYTEVFTAALAGAGIFGIAVGFAAKDTFSNMISGIFMTFDRPFRLGQVVEIDGKIGVVEEIGFRLTKLKTFDNKRIIMPNSKISNTVVINHSIKGTRRAEVNVGIAYESDLDKAIKILSDVPKKIKGAIIGSEKKSVQVIVQNFGDSSVDLSLKFWVDTKQGSPFAGQSEARKLILKEFAKSGIEIPYPKRVLYEASKGKKKK